MVKNLSYWNNRKTTLSVADLVYEGKVLRELSGKPKIIDGHTHKIFSYYFLTNEGIRIPISVKSITSSGSGLVLKLNPPFSRQIH